MTPTDPAALAARLAALKAEQRELQAAVKALQPPAKSRP